MMSAQGTVDLLVDANDPHRQLHQALHYACQHPRKHSRTSSYDTIESGWSSDESGRFDDADESDSSPQLTGATSPSNSNSHSAKRRRSNDWPNQPTPQAQAQAQPQAQHHHSLWPFHHHGRTQPGSPRASPATGKRPSGNSAAAASKKNLGRRSRFVEESMNDSVSEKPPSIFLREEPRSSSSASSSSRNGANAPGQRNSGIFRFGKAIASAFNPFGVWGNVSDIWKNAPQESKPATAANDALAQAEKAYAELKQAGYKGTAKGSYLQQQQQQQQQQAMGPDPVAARQHSRQNSGEGQSSIRNSFQDLRRAKSSLGISSISLLSNSNRRSEESDGAEVRRQKSRRELQKQAKLLKRVSNLEDKLERARRELQQLMGEDESEAQSQSQSQPLPQTQSQPESTETPTGLVTATTTTLCQDEKTYHRKFVPGALPSLPSERLLQEESTPLSSLSENVQRTPAKDKGNEPRRPTGKRPAAPKSSKQLTEDQTSGLAVDSPSRKRKSPEPAFAEGVDATETGTAKEHAQSTHEDEAPVNADVNSPLRKLPKTARGDSPRSVEHKQSRERLQSPEDRRERTQTPPPSSRRATGKRTPSSRRISNSRNTTPCLRMKKSRSDLRSASMDADGLTDADKENQEAELSPRKLYLQEQAQSSPSRSPGKRKHSYSYIPPVPPLPKDLAAAAAAAAAATKLDRQRVKESGQQRETQEYKWPEDIF